MFCSVLGLIFKLLKKAADFVMEFKGRFIHMCQIHIPWTVKYITAYAFLYLLAF